MANYCPIIKDKMTEFLSSRGWRVDPTVVESYWNMPYDYYTSASPRETYEGYISPDGQFKGILVVSAPGPHWHIDKMFNIDNEDIVIEWLRDNYGFIGRRMDRDEIQASLSRAGYSSIDDVINAHLEAHLDISDHKFFKQRFIEFVVKEASSDKTIGDVKNITNARRLIDSIESCKV
jgi:hypothetical protein